MTGVRNSEQLYCDGPGRDGNPCGRDSAGHGADGKCGTHLKQLQRTGRMTPIAEKLTPEERCIEAWTAHLEADGDAEYEATKRRAIAASKGLTEKERREAIRRALAAARDRGVRLGRPPKPIDLAEVKRLATRFGPEDVAFILKVGRATLYRFVSKRGILRRPPPTSPRSASAFL